MAAGKCAADAVGARRRAWQATVRRARRRRNEGDSRVIRNRFEGDSGVIRSDSHGFNVIRTSWTKKNVQKIVVSAYTRVIRVTPTLYFIKLIGGDGGARGSGELCGTVF